MALTLEQLINESGVLVSNEYSIAEKVVWLNALNHEFFDMVKIPQTEQFTSVAGTKTYTLTGTIKEKDIDKVMAGTLKYRSLNYEDVQPAQNWYTFNETTRVLTLSSAPSQSGKISILRYAKSASTTFTTGGIATQTPDAPDEYHWIFVLGLAEYIAKAGEEAEKAQNYGDQYRNALQVAAQNYQKEGAT